MRTGGYILSVVLGVIAAVSCAPSRYILDVEMRHPSKAGVDLTGKNVTVVYGQDGVYPNDLFLESMADGFAWNLKDRYKESAGEVNVCSLRSAENYANRDSMLNLVVETGADVVFLLDKIAISGSSFSFVIKCYDSMYQADKLQLFSGNSVADTASGNEQIKNQGWETGKTIAAAFEPQWKHEQYSLYYFDSSDWYTALEKAEAFDWKAAIDIWMNMLQSHDKLRCACASYNIATACYMMGDYHLASQWLDNADQLAELLVSDGLRKRINARIG
jgi:tetratricopeptide (TPR) repeat protein